MADSIALFPECTSWECRSHMPAMLCCREAKSFRQKTSELGWQPKIGRGKSAEIYVSSKVQLENLLFRRAQLNDVDVCALL